MSVSITLADDVRLGDTFTLSPMTIPFSWDHLLSLLVPIQWSWSLCHKAFDHMRQGLFLGPLLFSFCCICPFHDLSTDYCTLLVCFKIMMCEFVVFVSSLL